MRIAQFSESSKFWTHIALSGYSWEYACISVCFSLFQCFECMHHDFIMIVWLLYLDEIESYGCMYEMNEIYLFYRMYNPYLLKEIYAKQEFWPLCKCILNTTVTSWKWISQCSICMSFVCVLKIILFVWETTLQKRL